MLETTRYPTRRKYPPFEIIQNQQIPQPTIWADLVALVNVVALQTVPKRRHFSFCWYLCWYVLNVGGKNLAFMRVAA